MTLAAKSFLASALAASALLAGIVAVALNVRVGVARCASGWIQGAQRCCAPGQTEQQGRCTGKPVSCPSHLEVAKEGCVARGTPISLNGGTLELSATDWDVLTSSHHTPITVLPFRLDPFEVTYDRFLDCVHGNLCSPLSGSREPGQPVTGIPAHEAQKFCAFAGGRLPSEAQWVFAASGGGRYRYPWGPFGLVCRRAAFGLERGPCASGEAMPELAGARPDGATPDGIFDLAGNVAEWVIRTDTSAVPLGGSFRSSLASSMKSWNTRPARDSTADDVGFRCAYAALLVEPSASSQRPSRRSSIQAGK
jgi:formylglycine-generating enzyme required for sulfatase activity